MPPSDAPAARLHDSTPASHCQHHMMLSVPVSQTQLACLHACWKQCQPLMRVCPQAGAAPCSSSTAGGSCLQQSAASPAAVIPPPRCHHPPSIGVALPRVDNTRPHNKKTGLLQLQFTCYMTCVCLSLCGVVDHQHLLVCCACACPADFVCVCVCVLSGVMCLRVGLHIVFTCHQVCSAVLRQICAPGGACVEESAAHTQHVLPTSSGCCAA